MIPVTVIGGYLGAGKTTLLNRLLHDAHGRRLAMIVNDFGRVNIDAALIASQEGETIGLANGCICCTLASGMLSTLASLRDRVVPPEQIVIEASGIADPGKIARYADLPGFRRAGVIVVVDAERIGRQWTDRYLGDTVQRQVMSADLLVLAKTDLLSGDEVDQIRRWLSGHAPDRPMVDARASAFAPVELLDLAGRHHETGWAAENHDALYRSVELVAARPIDRARFERSANGLPEDIPRAKGFVRFRDDPERIWLYQQAGRRWTLEPADQPGISGARIVVLLLVRDAALFDAALWFGLERCDG